MSPEPPDPSLPARLREFHARLPLAGDPPNTVLSLPDDRVLRPRNTPGPAPALPAEEWQEFLDPLKPHGVYPLLAYRLRAWPADVMAWLNRVFLYAAAMSMRAGRACQQHYTPQGRPFIEPRDQGRLAGSACRFEVLHRRPSNGSTVP